MIKRKILAFIAFAAMISASAQTSAPKATNANSPDSASLTVATPTDTVSIAVAATSDGADVVNFHSDEVTDNTEAGFDEIDESYYRMHREDTLDALLEENIANNVVVLIIVIFLIPCLTIGFIVWIIMRFFIKRNRERNSIIEQAINAGYQLPETFYTGQPNNYNIINGEMAPNAPDAAPQQIRQDIKAMQIQPATNRDPGKFSSAATLIAIGAALSLYTIVKVGPDIWLLGGLVMLLLGIGKMIGYFYVPATTIKPKQNNRQYPTPPVPPQPMPPYQGMPHNPNRPPFTPPQTTYPNPPCNNQHTPDSNNDRPNA